MKNNVEKLSNKNIKKTAPCQKKILHENISSKETIEDTRVKLLQSNEKNLTKTKVQEKTNTAVKSPRVLRLKGSKEGNKTDKITIKLDSSGLTLSSDSDDSYSEKSDSLFLPSDDSDFETLFISNEVSENYKTSAKKPQVLVCESFLASLSGKFKFLLLCLFIHSIYYAYSRCKFGRM